DEAINVLTKSDTLANGFITIALNEVTETIADTLECERVSVWMLNEEAKALSCAKLYERSKHAHTGGKTLEAAEFPLLFSLIKEDAAMAFENVEDEPRLRECIDTWFAPNDVRSALMVPVHRGGKLAGIVVCENVGQKRPWLNDERNFVVTVSDLVSLALEAKERRDAISKLKAKETELNRALRDLNTNRARLEDALNIAQLATWEHDLKTDKLTLDDLHFKWMNTTREAVGGFSLPFKDWVDKYVHPEDAPRVLEEAEKLKTAEAEDYRAVYEYRMKPVMEEARYLEVTVRGVRDDKGRLAKAVGITLDVTERKKAEMAEKALRERKERQQITLATLAKSEGVLHGDMETAVRDFCVGVCATLSVERTGVWMMDGETLVCKGVYSALEDNWTSTPDFALEYYPRFSEALREGRPIAAQFAKFDPRTREFTQDYYAELGVASALIVPVQYQGQIVGMLNVERLGIPRAWFDDEKSFAASVGDLLALVIEAQNRRLAIERLEAKEIELSKLNEELQVTVNERTEAMERLKKAQSQLIQSEKMASLGLLIAGVAHEVNTPISAVKASARNLLRSLPVVLQDVPALLEKLPESLRELFFKLVAQAAQASSDLSSSEERAHRKNVKAILDEYDVPDSYELAKELVEIRIIENIEQFIPLFEHPQSREILDKVYTLGQFKKNLDNIDVAAEKTARVVRALKTYSHTQQQDKFVLASLTENIETILTVYANQLKYGVNVVKNFGSLPNIPLYPDEIGQVWTNIINNAVYAMGGKGTLTIDVGADGDHAFVRIADTGPGIPPQVLERIFEPFFTTKPQGEGTGLGLDICRKIVEKHRGTIEVESVPGRTAFTVRLPLTQPEEEVEAA
ncbi:MAG: GAF domain-containing protein, partial [Bacteroidia bacterium]|nr:GAF domain-containing protein [Bacteroidia bacterium]